MLVQMSEWAEQPISAVIRIALRAYYEAIKFERDTPFGNEEIP